MSVSVFENPDLAKYYIALAQENAKKEYQKSRQKKKRIVGDTKKLVEAINYYQ